MNVKSFLELLYTENSNLLIAKSLKTMEPDNKRYTLYVFILLFFSILSIFIINDNNTIALLVEISNDFLTIALTLLGVSLTVFALLQVTLSEDTINHFFKYDKNSNAFIETSLHILGFIIYYTLLLIINLLAKYLFLVYKDNIPLVFQDLNIFYIIKFISINLYFFANIHGIIEFISVTTDIYSVFIMDVIKKAFKK